MDIEVYKHAIDVITAEVKVCSASAVLHAQALGSCVAIAAHDKINKIGGLAHVMLPGKSPESEKSENPKYAADAIALLLARMQRCGSDIADIEVNLFGGANVLGEGSINEEIVKSILGYLKARGIKPKNEKLGGNTYRTVSLDIDSGAITYCEGSSEIKTL
ncbi:MAG: chemotaxis protein CheD [Candidatus Omnitrophica bacterium]|nr:chemotaxis protein CheD [Candidatus Omnitrophota bacterium]